MTGINIRISPEAQKKLKASGFKIAPFVSKLIEDYFNDKGIKQEPQVEVKRTTEGTTITIK